MIKSNRRLIALKRIFESPVYIVLAVAAAIIFYFLFEYLVASSNHGLLIFFIPQYYIYALVATSGILLSISVFTVMHSLSRKLSGATGGILSVLLPSVGGLVVSCGCEFPILASVLLFFGINTFEAIGLISIISTYQTWIISGMVLINLALIYFYAGLAYHPRRKR